MFDKIFENAIKNQETNLDTNKKEIEQEEKHTNETTPEERLRESENSNARWEIINNLPNKNDVYSEELFDLIVKYGFNVVEYGRRIDKINYYEEYDPTEEYYSILTDKYKFIIKHFADVDIEEGISGIYNITNINTGEIINYYLDFTCRNTCEIKRDNFLILLTCDSLDEYYDKIYSQYKAIPQLLEEKGINVIETKMEFTPDAIKGYIALENKLFVIPYRSWTDDIRVVVSNKAKWDVNSSNSSSQIGYYVSFKSIEDIDVLIDNINALKKHVDGEYGFLEDGKYYRNKDVEKIFKFKRTDEHGKYYDDFNHYHIRIEQVREWDGRGYGSPYINVYNGLEMATHFKLTFNDAAQWSIGDIINHSDIIVKYDKKIDPDKCILMIKNYEYTHQDDYWMGYSDYDDDYEMETIDDYDKSYDPKFLVDEIVIHDTFTNIEKVLNDYIYGLAKIFNVTLIK